MDHTLLLASLERLHDRITTLEKGVGGHLGTRHGNPSSMHDKQHNPIHHTRNESGRNPEHTVAAHAIVVDTVAEEIVHIAESWVRHVDAARLVHVPTSHQRSALEEYIKRHNNGIPKAALSAAVERHLSTSVITQHGFLKHLIPTIRQTVNAAYS